MALVVASIPWAGAGTFVCCRGIALKLLRLDGRWGHRAQIAAMGLAIVGSLLVQMKPNHLNHLSRWGTGRPGDGWPLMPGPTS